MKLMLLLMAGTLCLANPYYAVSCDGPGQPMCIDRHIPNTVPPPVIPESLFLPYLQPEGPLNVVIQGYNNAGDAFGLVTGFPSIRGQFIYSGGQVMGPIIDADSLYLHDINQSGLIAANTYTSGFIIDLRTGSHLVPEVVGGLPDLPLYPFYYNFLSIDDSGIITVEAPQVSTQKYNLIATPEPAPAILLLTATLLLLWRRVKFT